MESAIDRLLNRRRLCGDSPAARLLASLVVAVWAPIGLLLLFIRVGLMVVLSVAIVPLPPLIARTLVSAVLPLFGILVRCYVPLRSPEGGFERVYDPQRLPCYYSPLTVANHVANYDPIAMMVAHNRTSAVMFQKYQTNLLTRSYVQKLQDPVYVDPKNPALAKDAIEAAAKQKYDRWSTAKGQWGLSSLPGTLVVFPEGGLTNGAGMLKFKPFTFSLGVPVTPVALRVRPVLLPIHLDHTHATLVWNTLWLWFTPFVIYDLVSLPMMYAPSPPLGGKQDDGEAFSTQVQGAIAASLAAFTGDRGSWVSSAEAISRLPTYSDKKRRCSELPPCSSLF
jgi:1-acyl-sn-glycerol-3-phosphate acyltransferase